MPKFEFQKEYFEEHYEEEERLKGKPKNKFIPIEDVPSKALNPEEAAILKEERIDNFEDENHPEEDGDENDIKKQQEKFNFAEEVEKLEKAKRQKIEQELEKEFNEMEEMEEKAKKMAPKEISKPLRGTKLHEQSSKERYYPYNKSYRSLTRSKHHQGRKPKYKDKR